jgi:hypothetical protein
MTQGSGSCTTPYRAARWRGGGEGLFSMMPCISRVLKIDEVRTIQRQPRSVTMSSGAACLPHDSEKVGAKPLDGLWMPCPKLRDVGCSNHCNMRGVSVRQSVRPRILRLSLKSHQTSSWASDRPRCLLRASIINVRLFAGHHSLQTYHIRCCQLDAVNLTTPYVLHETSNAPPLTRSYMAFEKFQSLGTDHS